MRQAIAEHMVRSVRTSPHVTTVFEADMSAVVRHRAANRAAFAEKGLSLTFTPYFVAVVAEALKAVPEANSRFREEGILFNRRVNVGMAVSVESKGERGLVVPVIRDADEKNLAGLARTVADLAQRARSGRLAPDETQGGTFTLTNHGVSGSLMGTPIINQPQSAILGIGAIVKRPVVINAGGASSLLPSADDAIVIRPMCYLSLSFDHRVLDGAGADAFLAKVKDLLENWKE
jgi:2-oxoglutarate dehydrogenase E2 component (dihydrolipoamide succinyltransferase)